MVFGGARGFGREMVKARLDAAVRKSCKPEPRAKRPDIVAAACANYTRALREVPHLRAMQEELLQENATLRQRLARYEREAKAS